MNRTQRRFGYRCVFAVVAVASTIAPARAQQANIRTVTFYSIKPERVGDFLAATKEYAAVLAKGGSERSYAVWHSLTGANEYALVRNYSKWADLDVTGTEPKMKEQAADLQSIGSRISQCEESTHREIEEVLPDYSLPQAGTAPSMIRVPVTRVRADKLGDYMALVKSDVLPAAKKAGVKAYSVAQVRYGGPSTEIVSVAGMSNWADSDGGTWIEKAMGQDGYQRFLLKLRPFIIESEAVVYRFVPDFSYLPAAK